MKKSEYLKIKFLLEVFVGIPFLIWLTANPPIKYSFGDFIFRPLPCRYATCGRAIRKHCLQCPLRNDVLRVGCPIITLLMVAGRFHHIYPS